MAVLIPAWQPNQRLVRLVRQLISAGFATIIVVDDGSGERFAACFSTLESLTSVHVLRHAVNLGKGRALKTGIHHFLSACPHLAGLVSADADGQHTASDIVRVAHATLESDGRIVLGSRGFDGNVPLRSKFGNVATKNLFAFVTGTKLADTQTGLRGFPRETLPGLLGVGGERYEYEMAVLAHVCRTGATPMEIPIETVYIDGNRSSHFNPLRDSMRVYFVLARFFSSSLLAAAIDFIGFSLAFAVTRNVLLSVVVGRLSSLVNYALNRSFVFRHRSAVWRTLWRYYLLALVVGGLSFAMIRSLTDGLHWNTFAAKVAADVLLSLISFSVQNAFVFKRSTVA